MLQICAFTVLVCLVAGAEHVNVESPVTKVVALLGRLRNQVQEEGKNEAAGYDRFACFCKEQADNKAYALEKSAKIIEKLEASIEELGGKIAQLDSEVAERKTELSAEQKEANAARSIQSEEVKTYEAKRADLVAAVDAVGRALESMEASKAEVADKKAAAVLLALEAFLVRHQEAPATYTYQSKDVIATLQGLQKTFKSELAELDKTASAAAHDFAMIEGARANKMRAYEAEIDKKNTLSAGYGQEKASSEGSREEELSAKAADQSFLDELTSSCDEKAKAWDERSKTRAAEITALTEAMTLLNGMGDLYSANSKLTGLVTQRQHVASAAPHGHWVWVSDSAAPTQLVAGPALLQRDQARYALRLRPVVRYLDAAARRLKSESLSSLASEVHVQAAEDHFARVRELIKDLIAKLEAAATEEADQKSFCDKQMDAAISERDTKRSEMEGFQASIDETTSAVATLSEEIASLGEAIAGLHKALNEMTELREREKAQNSRTVADAAEGAASVKQALTILKEFYQPGAMLVQRYTPTGGDRQGDTVSDLAPETFEGEYKGKVDSSTGILGMLEVIASDFDRTVDTTKDAEDKAQAEFEKAEADTNADIATKEDAKASKESEKDTKEADLTNFKDSLRDTTKLHASALEELEKLKPACIDAAESWQERTARREEEIDALKHALQILEEWK